MKAKKKKPFKLGIRKSWSRNPVQKPHSTKKGKKGYDRKEGKQIERDCND